MEIAVLAGSIVSFISIVALARQVFYWHGMADKWRAMAKRLEDELES